MSSPFRRADLFALGAALVLVTACHRETRTLKATPESGPQSVTVSELFPGGAPATVVDPHAREYEGNAYHISNGQKYYKWFNCNGCHGNGGGAIGPAFIDPDWRYGGQIQNIYASIIQGRPNGMPSFRDKIPDTQVWEIAAFIRSMSGNANKLAAPSRDEAMTSTPPINNVNKTPPSGADPTAVTSTPR
ncbi:MAG TPA: cytochrome c [Caulobacteraceae bacterium]|nr:cytochrome c [Caulobacteraceae bacterium]